MNRKVRIIALLLTLVLSLGVLTACPGNGDGNIETGERVDGDWSNVKFQNNELVVSLSANDPDESNMGTSILYTKGPDKASTDKVAQKAYNRNRAVAEMLEIDVKYQTTDDYLLEALDAIEKQMNNTTPPDVYSDDMYALLRAMFQGYLKNLLDFGTNKDGEPVQNFLDFNYDGWYKDYMKGVTLDVNKQYLMAGDYFIDIVRFAWVLFVNVDQYNETFAKELDWKNYDYTAKRIESTGEWTYDDLIKLSGKAHKDTVNKGVTDIDDERIGLLFNSVSERIALWTAGVSIVEWKGADGGATEQGMGTPTIVGAPGKNTDPATKSLLSNIASAYKELYQAGGVYNTGATGENGNKEATDLFVNARAIFSTMLLGEMESKALRDVKFNRGILPYPKYTPSQREFHTLVHDQAEVGCILKNSRQPTMASAFMQAVNENSKDVLHEYYENSLKVKYNQAGDGEGGVKLMIDLVYDNIDSPFESLISNYICLNSDNDIGNYSVYTYMRQDAKNNTNNFSSKYDAAAGVLQTKLEEFMDIFNNRLK